MFSSPSDTQWSSRFSGTIFAGLGLTFRPCLRGAASVLEALAGGPIMAGQGERLQTFGGTGYVVVFGPYGAVSWQGRRLAAVIPSGFPRLPAAGAWGGPRRAAGSIRGAAAPPGGGGPDLQAITRCPCPGLLTRPRAHGCGRPGT